MLGALLQGPHLAARLAAVAHLHPVLLSDIDPQLLREMEAKHADTVAALLPLWRRATS